MIQPSDRTLPAFRSDVRQWIEQNLPAAMRTAMPEDETPWGGKQASWRSSEARNWLTAMASRGWTAPTWPRDYGGGGLNPDEAAILHDELNAVGARPALFSFGVMMLGPVLLEYATEEQRRRFLPPIARGEIRWCQGYSEPGAGSDLASLRTRADDKGDHWLLNGQKVWTTNADESDWIFCLVRTDQNLPKHRGISFILVDLASPGVTVRPIRLISGSSPFCETFFSDVRVPKENLIGPLNEGWVIAKKLLQYERQNISAAGFGADRSVTPAMIAKQVLGTDDQGRIADIGLRDKISHQLMVDDALRLMTKQAAMAATSGGASAASSLIKYASAKANQDRHELIIEMLGLDGLGSTGDEYADGNLAETRKWLRSKGNSIEGGTSEINLNVLAKQVLGLGGLA